MVEQELTYSSPSSIGHTIVFTDQSGMNALGHVMLGSKDVHHQWAKVSLVCDHNPCVCVLSV